MKWAWVLIAVLLVPGSVQGKDWRFYTLTDGAMRHQSKALSPRVSRFSAFATSEVMNVRMDVRVFIAKNHVPDERTKGHCYMRLGRKIVPNMQDHFIYGNNGPEIWLPHLQAGDNVDVFIIWKPEAATLQYTTIAIGNYEKNHRSAWLKDERSVWKMPQPERLAQYRALSLDDICETFTSEAIKGFQLPKT